MEHLPFTNIDQLTILKNAIKARAEARTKDFQVTLKRRIGYHDENEDDEEDMPDAARMRVDGRA